MHLRSFNTWYRKTFMKAHDKIEVILRGSRRVRFFRLGHGSVSQVRFFAQSTERKQPRCRGGETPETSDMERRAVLLFILTAQLEIHAVCTFVSLYSRRGQDVLLPCLNALPSDTPCSLVSWGRTLNQKPQFVVVKGQVDRSFSQVSRLSLDPNCSLVIRNVSAEDASVYTCRQARDNNLDKQVSLSVMTVSPSEPVSVPGDGEVTLRCTLWQPDRRCPRGSLRWRGEAGTELPGGGAGHTLLGQTDCVSMVTVRRQAGPNRKYTCQFVKGTEVAITADYTPDFSDEPADHRSIIIIIAVVAVVVAVAVLVAMVAVLIKYRKRSRATEDLQKLGQPADEPGIDLTYITVSHSHLQAAPRTKVKGDEVTYSTLKTVAKKEADDVPSSFSRESKPQETTTRFASAF
ncbi:uncharacterized protein AB9W97_003061 isoform 1-T1 [Spinachia spinachia]